MVRRTPSCRGYPCRQRRDHSGLSWWLSRVGRATVGLGTALDNPNQASEHDFCETQQAEEKAKWADARQGVCQQNIIDLAARESIHPL